MTALQQAAPQYAADEMRIAPSGFTDDQWRTFNANGIVCIEDVLTPDAVAEYLAAAKACIGEGNDYDAAHTWKIRNVIAQHPLFRELIDHERHVGYAYDLYGDQLRLVQSDIFVRPTGSIINNWHVDGPRALPYSAFSPVVPLKLRIGYWFTDVTEPDMGNLLFLPGSHRATVDLADRGMDDITGQRPLLCRAGSMSIAHAGVWHRVMGNSHQRTRVNLFLSYTPSWVTGYYDYGEEFLSTLTREQRIILRAYGDKEDLTRPPAGDLPLFQEADISGQVREEFHKRRRHTRYERHLAHL